MDKFVVNGGKKLQGEVILKAAKNSVLPMIACSILTKEDVILKNIPSLSDITNMLKIIKNLGGTAEEKENSVYINNKNAAPSLITGDLTNAIRSSIFMLGPILSRFKYARLGMPGGCDIGARPIDIHIDGLTRLNAKIKCVGGFIECDGSDMRGGAVNLKFPSVGATENIMMAAVLTKGTTVINNAALEPEIIDLANFINTLGGCISGAGTGKITVEGVKELNGGNYYPLGDRIAAPTYLTAACITKGNITVRGVSGGLFSSVLDVFYNMGCKVKTGNDFVTVSCSKRLNACGDIFAAPYPSFPTDMQPQIVSALAAADGISQIKETVFEKRFNYTNQLNKLGAKIEVNDNIAVITGVKKLLAAEVTVQDLRGGAALTLASLGIDGATVINDICHIDRGYDKMEDVLLGLGADIRRETINKKH